LDARIRDGVDDHRSRYGDMFLPRADNSWEQWLHVSKHPPSITYYLLELGILFLCLALLRVLELRIGVRENGPFYVFGQTAMFFYLVYRLVFEVSATYFGLRGFDGLAATYIISAVMLVCSTQHVAGIAR
jgi:predicted acyltransferase